MEQITKIQMKPQEVTPKTKKQQKNDKLKLRINDTKKK